MCKKHNLYHGNIFFRLRVLINNIYETNNCKLWCFNLIHYSNLLIPTIIFTFVNEYFKMYKQLYEEQKLMKIKLTVLFELGNTGCMLWNNDCISSWDSPPVTTQTSSTLVPSATGPNVGVRIFFPVIPSISSSLFGGTVIETRNRTTLKFLWNHVLRS